MQPEIIRFFMGTSTKNGFLGFPRDYFENDPDAHAFFIKSGPGTGKSTLLRSLAAAFRKKGESVEEIVCSSDPDSLDGLYFPTRRVCIFDATAPHVLEPQSWGATEELVSLGDALDTAALAAKREEIARAAAENAAAHARARRYLSGACDLFSDRAQVAESALRREPIARMAARFGETELKAAAAPSKTATSSVSGGGRRFLSAVTPQGLLTFFDTPKTLCPRVILLNDPHSAAAFSLLERLRDLAAARDLPYILCPHPLSPDRIAHLLFPSIGVAFVSAEKGGEAFSPSRTLHLKRCYDERVLKANKNRTAFDKKGEHTLCSAAVSALAEAKIAHDLLEKPYKNAMNFKKVEAVKKALYQRISAFPQRS